MKEMVTFKAVGDWGKQIDVPLHNALMATVEMTGRSGRQACEMALVYMARSARAMTKQARKNRKTKRDQHGRYVEVREFDVKPSKFYKWMFDAPEKRPAHMRGMTWEGIRRVPNRGLAKRSWFWGIAGLGKPTPEGKKPMPGVVTVEEFIGGKECGLILTNRLGYLRKVTPPNVESLAAQKASNQIMAQAAKRFERQFGIEVPRLAAQRQKRKQAHLARTFQLGAKTGLRGVT